MIASYTTSNTDDTSTTCYPPDLVTSPTALEYREYYITSISSSIQQPEDYFEKWLRMLRIQRRMLASWPLVWKWHEHLFRLLRALYTPRPLYWRRCGRSLSGWIYRKERFA